MSSHPQEVVSSTAQSPLNENQKSASPVILPKSFIATKKHKAYSGKLVQKRRLTDKSHVPSEIPKIPEEQLLRRITPISTISTPGRPAGFLLDSAGNPIQIPESPLDGSHSLSVSIASTYTPSQSTQGSTITTTILDHIESDNSDNENIEETEEDENTKVRGEEEHVLDEMSSSATNESEVQMTETQPVEKNQTSSVVPPFLLSNPLGQPRTETAKREDNVPVSTKVTSEVIIIAEPPKEKSSRWWCCGCRPKKLTR